MAPKISLIGLDQAVEGNVFTFVQPLQTCSECKIRNVCFNLERGRKYIITEVRKNQHQCNVFNHDRVATIQVEEVEDELVVEYGNKVQEGSSMNMRSRQCDHITCDFIEQCNLIHYESEIRINIKKIGEKVNCPKGYNMRKISTTRALKK